MKYIYFVEPSINFMHFNYFLEKNKIIQIGKLIRMLFLYHLSNFFFKLNILNSKFLLKKLYFILLDLFLEIWYLR